MQQVPYEIWLLIISYLPIEIARELYSVNKSFFDIAMNLRYKQAWIQTHPEDLLHGDMRIFRYTHLSSRPRTLRIDLGSFGNSALTTKGSVWKFIRNRRTLEKIITTALHAFPRLTRVTKLYISYGRRHPPCYDRIILQLITEVWRTFQGRLEFLLINACSEMLETILPPSLHLPYLETFFIDTSAHVGLKGCQVDQPTVIPTITHFLAGHERSLRHIHFSTLNYFANLPSLFHYLQNMCQLRSANLKELRICISSSPLYQELLVYVQQFAQSLTTLSIQRKLSYWNAEELAPILQNFLSLQYLSIPTRCLSPDILALLARTLPNLRALKLFCHYVAYERDMVNADEHDIPLLFDQAMRQHARIFSDWKLESLLYFLMSQESFMDQIEKTIADYLPNVKWLNQRSETNGCQQRHRFLGFCLGEAEFSLQ